jgi:hypothetical protein
MICKKKKKFSSFIIHYAVLRLLFSQIVSPIGEFPAQGIIRADALRKESKMQN